LKRRLDLISTCGVALAAMGLLLAGCRQRGVSPVTDPGAQPVSHRVEEGPCQASIMLEPRQVRTSGCVRLTIEVTAPAGATVANLNVEDALPKDWTVTDRKHTTPSANARQHTERFVFTIEPYLPGHFEIKSLDIHCDLKGDGSTADDRVTLHSIAVPVEVVSEWANGEASGEPAALRGVVDAPPARWPWWAWTGMVGTAVLLLAIVAWLVARSRRPYIPESIRKPAHEIALIELGRLVADQLIERGDYKPFYQRITGILRRYIENRFHLRAPEQTTEEFLDGSRSASVFNTGDLRLLEEFLTHCDMVKFAEHRPDHTQMTSTLDTVRAFVERTRSEDAIVERPANAGSRRVVAPPLEARP